MSAKTTLTANAKKGTICKRPTTLHTEICSQSSNYCASVEGNGKPIIYGNLGENNTTLNTGDALVCDVNGDGTFNETNEMFYYVSDYYDTTTQTFNSDYATLIYYTNTKNGNITNDDEGVAYSTLADIQEVDSSITRNDNWHGPVTAVKHLPTTSSWNNISLYKTNRQILAENNATSTSGGTLPTAFSYSGKAARLLTYQEVYNGCYDGSTAITYTNGLHNCNFLLENTSYSTSSSHIYGTWLETPKSSYNVDVWGNISYLLFISYYTSDAPLGARPAIEIEKSSIDKTVRKAGIFYFPNGGTGTMNPKYVNPNTSTTLDSNTYTRSGYVFDGWNTKQDGSGTSYSNSGTIVPTTGVLKLYAQWRRVRASELYYDNTNTGMNCETAQCAIDYLKMKLYRKTLNGLVEENGNLYYYKNGVKQTGWLKVNGDYYMFDSSTKAAKKSYWYQFNSRWYYFKDNGKMALGVTMIDGHRYYFYSPKPYSQNDIGKMAYGEYIDGYWYKSDADKIGQWNEGALAQWKQGSGGWWYQDTSGWYPKNESYWIDGVQYNFDSSGYCTNCNF